MKNWQVALLLIAAIAPLYLYSSETPLSSEQAFEEWAKEFGHTFTNEEEAFRRLIFISNYNQIQTHNADPSKSYKKGVNQFTHLTKTEFKEMFLSRFYKEQASMESEEQKVEEAPILRQIDWQALGKVSEVGNQGICDAGYAFCSAGLIESFYAITQNKNLVLSKQQIVDCSASYTTFGCQSGSRNGTLTYIRENGLTTQAQYPYKGVKNNCQQYTAQYKPSYQHVQFNGCSNIQNGLYASPLTVAVNALDWQTYRSGIFDGCTSVDVNHDILLIGWNADSWRLKNSWGQRWGEYGYIRLKTGNTCGICEKPAFGFK